MATLFPPFPNSKSNKKPTSSSSASFKFPDDPLAVLKDRVEHNDTLMLWVIIVMFITIATMVIMVAGIVIDIWLTRVTYSKGTDADYTTVITRLDDLQTQINTLKK